MSSVRLPNNWSPRPYQRPAWDYLERGGKHCEIVWHRRCGKDEVCLHRTSVAMHERVGNYWTMLPKANQARKAIWDAVNPKTGKRRVDEAFPQELRGGMNDHEMMIKMKCGSTWQVVGSDNFDSLMGSPPVGLTFSEWPLCNPAAWAYMRPILAENGGWHIKNGTPRGRNHAYRTLKAAQEDPRAFGQVLTVAHTSVFTPEQMESEKTALIKEYGHEFGLSIFEQEYFCSFDAANLGAILGRYVTEAEREERVAAFAPDPDGAPLEISSDIGFRDTASWWFWQPLADGFLLAANDSDSGLDADDWVERLAAKVKTLGVKLGRIWLPHDAKAKTFATRHSPMERFLEAFGTDVVRVIPQTKKLDQINAARKVIQHCRFDKEGCGEGLEGLASWSFAYDEELKDFGKEPLHDWASHHGDAFAYGALMMRERVIEKPKPVPEIRGVIVNYPGVGMQTGQSLNEMWEENARPKSAARV